MKQGNLINGLQTILKSTTKIILSKMFVTIFDNDFVVISKKVTEIIKKSW
jgi:hypothetical protein